VKIGICCSTEDAGLARGAGADFIEVNVQGFLKPRDGEEAFAASRAAAEACDLPILAANCFLPGDLPSTGEHARMDPIADYAEVAFRRANEIGIRTIVFGSGGSRQVPDGFDRKRAEGQFIALLQRLGPIAETHDVTLVVEPLRRAECNFINTVAEGAEIVEAAGHPNVQLLADFYHMLHNDEPPVQVNRVGHLLAHTHVAEREERTAPGIRGDDFRPFLVALKESGYDGPISMECKWPAGLETDAKQAVEALRKQADDAGLTV